MSVRLGEVVQDGIHPDVGADERQAAEEQVDDLPPALPVDGVVKPRQRGQRQKMALNLHCI